MLNLIFVVCLQGVQLSGLRVEFLFAGELDFSCIVKQNF